MKKIILASAIAALMIPTASFAQTSPAPAAAGSIENMTTEQYVATAASSDMFEIQSSELALEMAQGAEVKEFAQQMVTDHSKTTENLMAAAEAEGITPPGTMAPNHAEMLQRLQGADASGFDAMYLEMQVQAHREAVALHSAYAENGDVEALRTVAAQAVPIVTAHYEHVQGLAGR